MASGMALGGKRHRGQLGTSPQTRPQCSSSVCVFYMETGTQNLLCNLCFHLLFVLYKVHLMSDAYSLNN